MLVYIDLPRHGESKCGRQETMQKTKKKGARVLCPNENRKMQQFLIHVLPNILLYSILLYIIDIGMYIG